MVGLRPRDGVWVGIAGLDIVRDGEGRWLVLEDNVRTPSGFGYWFAAREATCRRLALGDEDRPEPLRRAAPTPGRRARPRPRRRAHRRAGQLGLLGARLVRGAARRPARPARRPRGPRRSPLARRRGGRRGLPAFEPGHAGHGGGTAPPSCPWHRRGEDGQLLRHGRRRRQARARLRARHDPVLPRRSAAARSGGDLRPRRSRGARARAGHLRRSSWSRIAAPTAGRASSSSATPSRRTSRTLRGADARRSGRVHRPAPGVALHAPHGGRRAAARRATSTCARSSSSPARTTRA